MGDLYSFILNSWELSLTRSQAKSTNISVSIDVIAVYLCLH